MTISLRLPRPLLDAYEWQDQGACRRSPTSVFFEGESDGRARYSLNDEAAKRICSHCPVIAQCRAHGLAAEVYGVWGGLNARERNEWRRDHGQGVA